VQAGVVDGPDTPTLRVDFPLNHHLCLSDVTIMCKRQSGARQHHQAFHENSSGGSACRTREKSSPQLRRNKNGRKNKWLQRHWRFLRECEGAGPA
jgi:hypothetical protein